MGSLTIQHQRTCILRYLFSVLQGIKCYPVLQCSSPCFLSVVKFFVLLVGFCCFLKEESFYLAIHEGKRRAHSSLEKTMRDMSKQCWYRKGNQAKKVSQFWPTRVKIGNGHLTSKIHYSRETKSSWDQRISLPSRLPVIMSQTRKSLA